MVKHGRSAMLVATLSVACEGPAAVGGASTPSQRPLRCSDTPTSLSIEPALAQIDAGAGRTPEVRFSAVARFADGSTRVVTAAWSVDARSLGAIDGEGKFVPSGERGGTGRVRARARGVEASAGVEVVLIERLPQDAPYRERRRFSDALARRTGASAPRLEEPTSGASFTSGAPPPVFRWDGGGHTHFRLQWIGGAADVSILTRATEHVPDARDWERLSASAAGRPIRVVLEAADDSSDVVYRESTERTIRLCSSIETCDGHDEDCDQVTDENCAAPAASDWIGSDPCAVGGA